LAGLLECGLDILRSLFALTEGVSVVLISWNVEGIIIIYSIPLKPRTNESVTQNGHPGRFRCVQRDHVQDT